METRARIPEGELRELYFGQRLTLEQVAQHFTVAPTTIRRRFRDLKIEVRPRGPVPGSRTSNVVDGRPSKGPIVWTPDLAYGVGLIATDGNLSPRPGQLSIMSNDVDLLESVRQRLNLTARIRPHPGGDGHRCHRLAWSDRHAYDWLVAVGLTPAKSLTLGPLAIPYEYFADFFRGCIDGDGSIVTYVDRYNTFKSPAYVYTRLFVSIVSASPRFVEWLRSTVQRLRDLSGSLTVRRATGKRDMWCLRYAKRESLAVLRWMYYAPDVLCLARKREIAAGFLVPRTPPERRRTGRPMVL